MIGVSLLFIVVGILIKYGKMYFLIAGYNTMSKEERDKVNIKKLANLFKNTMFGMAIIITFGYLIAKEINNPIIENICFFGALLIGIPYLLIKSNSQKFRI